MPRILESELILKSPEYARRFFGISIKIGALSVAGVMRITNKLMIEKLKNGGKNVMSMTSNLAETESSNEIKAIKIGPLKQFGLGNASDNALGCKTSENEQADMLAKLPSVIVEKNDDCLGCIDGRCVKCQLNGEEVKDRGRQAGGSLAFDVMAMTTDAPIMMGIDKSATIDEKFEHIEANSDIQPSNHQGGCGAANGMIEHTRGMANANVQKATKTVIDYVNANYDNYLGADFDQQAMDDISVEASALAEKLDIEGWAKDQYVDRLEKDKNNHRAIEVLEMGDGKLPNNGHQETAIIFVIGDNKTVSEAKMKQLGLKDAFIITLGDSKEFATKLADGDNGLYQKAMISNIAFHLSVANDLALDDLPVIFIDAR